MIILKVCLTLFKLPNAWKSSWRMTDCRKHNSPKDTDVSPPPGLRPMLEKHLNKNVYIHSIIKILTKCGNKRTTLIESLE